jgi:hypothetical protein
MGELLRESAASLSTIKTVTVAPASLSSGTFRAHQSKSGCRIALVGGDSFGLPSSSAKATEDKSEAAIHSCDAYTDLLVPPMISQ